MENIPNRVIIHHTGDQDTQHQAAKIDRYHKSQNFPESQLGFFGGYHYLIEKDGLVQTYRLETEIGAHDKDENTNSIGIALAGNFSESLPTLAQTLALASLLEGIVKRWNIPITRIEPHRWGDTTDCPGNYLKDTWAQEVYLKYKISWLQKTLLWLLKKV